MVCGCVYFLKDKNKPTFINMLVLQLICHLISEVKIIIPILHIRRTETQRSWVACMSELGFEPRVFSAVQELSEWDLDEFENNKASFCKVLRLGALCSYSYLKWLLFCCLSWKQLLYCIYLFNKGSSTMNCSRM